MLQNNRSVYFFPRSYIFDCESFKMHYTIRARMLCKALISSPKVARVLLMTWSECL